MNRQSKSGSAPKKFVAKSWLLTYVRRLSTFEIVAAQKKYLIKVQVRKNENNISGCSLLCADRFSGLFTNATGPDPTDPAENQVDSCCDNVS